MRVLSVVMLGAALAAAPVHASPAPAAAVQVGAVADLLPSAPEGLFAGARRPEVLTAQVLLDRARFSPGVIDGLPGANTRRAVEAFQQANGQAVDGKVSPALLEALRSRDAAPVLRRHRLTEEDVEGPFLGTVPTDMEAMAELERVGYRDVVEKLAETHHLGEGLLRALNPGAKFAAGEEILLPAAGDESLPGEVARIEVDKASLSVRAFDAAGVLLARYPATIGSADLPSPSGSTTVQAVAPDAAYYFDPDALSWGPDKKLTVPPGPNNPVGGVWIDLEKDGYGIHGAPEPAGISKTASHGCVRLTNWDARELAAAVSAGVPVEFLDG